MLAQPDGLFFSKQTLDPFHLKGIANQTLIVWNCVVLAGSHTYLGRSLLKCSCHITIYRKLFSELRQLDKEFLQFRRWQVALESSTCVNV